MPTKRQHIIPKSPAHRRLYEGNRRARRQTATHWDGLADIAGDGNAYQIVAVDRPIRPEGRCRLLVGRVLVNRLGLIHRLDRLLLCAHIIVAAVRRRRSPMNFRGLLVMLGGVLVHFLSTADTPDRSTSR
jgi:hypothetical protein